MRIALVAEGCYPYVTGGVSTWCDQLVRGLPDHDFEVVAVTATGRARPVLALPDNVRRLRPVPLWDWTPRRRRPDAAALERLDGVYRALLVAMLDPQAVQRGFDLALRELFDLARRHDLTAAFADDRVVHALLDVWPDAYPDVPLPVRDAVEATELMAHMLLRSPRRCRGSTSATPSRTACPPSSRSRRSGGTARRTSCRSTACTCASATSASRAWSTGGRSRP